MALTREFALTCFMRKVHKPRASERRHEACRPTYGSPFDGPDFVFFGKTHSPAGADLHVRPFHFRTDAQVNVAKLCPVHRPLFHAEAEAVQKYLMLTLNQL